MELSKMAVLVSIWKTRSFLTSELSFMWYSLKHPAGQSDTVFSLEQDVENVKKKKTKTRAPAVCTTWLGGLWSSYI